MGYKKRIDLSINPVAPYSAIDTIRDNYVGVFQRVIFITASQSHQYTLHRVLSHFGTRIVSSHLVLFYIAVLNKPVAISAFLL